MKPIIDVGPLCHYVTHEVGPFHLVKCIHELTIEHIRLLLAEAEREDPGTEIHPRTYDWLFELHRVSSCLLEGVSRQMEPGVWQVAVPKISDHAKKDASAGA